LSSPATLSSAADEGDEPTTGCSVRTNHTTVFYKGLRLVKFNHDQASDHAIVKTSVSQLGGTHAYFEA